MIVVFADEVTEREETLHEAGTDLMLLLVILEL